MDDSIEVVASSWFRDEFGGLQDEDRNHVNRKLQAFAAKGWSPAVADRTIKHLRDGIYEFRILGHGPAFRLLFFVVPGRKPRIVVLTTCAAKSAVEKRQRLTAAVERARHRRAEWMAENSGKETSHGR